MGFRTVRIVAIALVAAAALVWSRPAHAKAETLKRSVSNILQAPLDYALMPYTAVDSLIQNYYRSERHGAVEKVLLTPVMGIIYLPSCIFMSGYVPAHRFLEGTFLLPVGLATAWTDTDIYLYDPVHGKRGAVVDKDPFYFGGRYCEGFFK
jgi:hypothetical protein